MRMSVVWRWSSCVASRTGYGCRWLTDRVIFGIADEDLERSTASKTSAVHFLRFELPAESVAALRAGAALAVGVDHPRLTLRVDDVPETLHESLLADLH